MIFNTFPTTSKIVYAFSICCNYSEYHQSDSYGFDAITFNGHLYREFILWQQFKLLFQLCFELLFQSALFDVAQQCNMMLAELQLSKLPIIFRFHWFFQLSIPVSCHR